MNVIIWTDRYRLRFGTRDIITQLNNLAHIEYYSSIEG
jgi:hypothetical protein